MSWQSNILPHSNSKADSYSVVIDDLDALEMFSPGGKAARVFMSRLIQSVRTQENTYRTQQSGSNNAIITDTSIIPESSSSSGSSSSSSSSSGDSSRESVKYPRSAVRTLCAYGRQSPTTEAFNISTDSSNSFFPTNVHHFTLGSQENSFEPTLSEYCRYRLRQIIVFLATSWHVSLLL